MKQLDDALRHDLQSVSMHGFSRGQYPAAIRVVGSDEILDLDRRRGLLTRVSSGFVSIWTTYLNL